MLGTSEGTLWPLGAPKPSAPARRSSQGQIFLSKFGLVHDFRSFFVGYGPDSEGLSSLVGAPRAQLGPLLGPSRIQRGSRP